MLCEGRPFALAESSGDRLVSIILPVKNPGPRLRELLLAIRRQRWSGSVEVVAIDSASEDQTVETLRELEATVISIEPRSFDHGLTRNLGAAHAAGETLVFVTQSMRPANDRWLANLLAPFATEPRLGGVSSRLTPHPDADPLTRLDGQRDLSFSPERTVRSIEDVSSYQALSPDERRRFVSFNTVSCAIRPEALREVPFRRVRTIGEDLLWAKEALEAGFKIAHEPGSVALHSHDYSFLELLGRNFDDGVAHVDVLGWRFEDDTIIGHIEWQVRADLRYLRDECGLEGTELERWGRESASRRTAQLVGQWLGTNHDRLPPEALGALSLVRRIVDATLGEA